MTTTLDHIKLADIPRYPNDDLTAKLMQRSTRALQDLCRAMGKDYDTKLFDFSRDERTNSKDKLIAFMRHVWYVEAFAPVMAKFESGQAQEAKQNEGDGAFEAAFEEAAQEFNGQRHSNGAAKATEATQYVEMGGPPFIEATPRITRDVPVAAPAPVVNDVASQMAALLSQLTANSVSPATIEAAVQKAVKEALERHTVSHRIVTPELPPIDVGIQHKHFPKLLKMANARMRDGSRLNVWVHGPAGSGKTTAARNVAKALSLPFYFNGSIDQAYKLTGYCDAHGKYNTTAFRQAWEHGGVYLFDEIDGSSPTAFLELNAALANGLATFPDRADSVPRHKDCIIIAGANTIGLGGTIEYVGRMRLDAASLDRFVFLDWPIDEALERALCANVEWSAKVQASRGKLKSAAIKGAMISPRATQYGEALLAAGLSESDVTSSVLRKGMPDAEWQKVRL